MRKNSENRLNGSTCYGKKQGACSLYVNNGQEKWGCLLF